MSPMVLARPLSRCESRQVVLYLSSERQQRQVVVNELNDRSRTMDENSILCDSLMSSICQRRGPGPICTDRSRSCARQDLLCVSPEFTRNSYT